MIKPENVEIVCLVDGSIYAICDAISLLELRIEYVKGNIPYKLFTRTKSGLVEWDEFANPEKYTEDTLSLRQDNLLRVLLREQMNLRLKGIKQ